MRQLARRLFRRLFPAPPGLPVLPDYREPLRLVHKEVREAKLLAGKILTKLTLEKGILQSLDDAEFKVFSQFGDDGIIQYLIHHADVRAEEHTFIEFGVESYEEANTRLLLVNNNWRGLVMDASADYVRSIAADDIHWQFDLTARQAFVDTDNINDLFTTHGFRGDIGLLSIDVDGNDYWIWKAVRVVSPVIVILEYNSVFGDRHAVTIPYDAAFERTKAHASNLYWGASLKAHYLLSQNKGYSFVGCNSNGNNAYFVRRDRLGKLQPVSLQAGYRLSRFRESRDASGRLTYVSGADRLALIRDMMVFDIEHGQSVRLRDLAQPETRRAA
jgi:hypothetical protein